MLGQSVIKTMI